MKQETALIDIVNEFISNEQMVLVPFDRNTLRIQQEMSKSEPDIRVLEKLIVSDQALTSQVLRTANSAFYKGLMKVTTVREALVRLGAVEVANVVTLVTHGKNFSSKDPFIRQIMSKLWSHSAGCAVGSHWIAKQCGLKAYAHEAFIGGLLHDVGKLFLLTVIGTLKSSGRIRNMPPYELVDELMVSMHTKYGESLLQNWNLPDMYCDIAAKHHDDDYDKENYLLGLVRLANQACNKMGIGPHGDPSIMLAVTDEAHHLGLSEVKLAELQIVLEDSLKLGQ
jgi:HD-like signal output (HDOD) protein